MYTSAADDASHISIFEKTKHADAGKSTTDLF